MSRPQPGGPNRWDHRFAVELGRTRFQAVGLRRPPTDLATARERLLHALPRTRKRDDLARSRVREPSIRVGLSGGRLAGIRTSAATSAGPAACLSYGGSAANPSQSKRGAESAQLSRGRIGLWLLLDGGTARTRLGHRCSADAEGWIWSRHSFPPSHMGARLRSVGHARPPRCRTPPRLSGRLDGHR